MTLELLISCVNEDVTELPSKMRPETDAVIVNQCDKTAYEELIYEGHTARVYHMSERGVGLSRNTAILHAKADILLFADEDIVYEPGYSEKISEAFEKRPDADILLFNVNVTKERRTYFTTQEKTVRWYNSGRYPAYSIAVRRESLLKANVYFPLLFGGGARYSNGEDSLFIWDCLKYGMKAVALPITIGTEIPRPSTWFHGFNKKFYFDRGVLYQRLYGRMAKPFALRFLFNNRAEMFGNADEKQEVKSFKEAYRLMKDGMREMK